MKRAQERNKVKNISPQSIAGENFTDTESKGWELVLAHNIKHTGKIQPLQWDQYYGEK